MIVSRQNRRIKDIRRLKRCKGDRALIEGPHLVEEAVKSGVELEYILMTPDFRDSPLGERLLSTVTGVEQLEVDATLFDSISDADSPRGILAVGELRRGGVETLPRHHPGLFIFVDGLQNPGNLGALVRSAEAFAVRGIALSAETAHPNHPRALRASAGSLLRVPVAIETDPVSLDSHLAALKPMWAALDTSAGMSLDSIESTPTWVLAVGAEGQGLSDSVLDLAAVRLTIPVDPAVESLNATVAASIALFEISQRGLIAGERS